MEPKVKIGEKLSSSFAQLFFPLIRKTFLFGLVYGVIQLIYEYAKVDILPVADLSTKLDFVFNSNLSLEQRAFTLGTLLFSGASFDFYLPTELLILSIISLASTAWFILYVYRFAFRISLNSRAPLRTIVDKSYFTKVIQLFVISIFYASILILTEKIILFISRSIFDPYIIALPIITLVLNIGIMVFMFRYFLAYPLVSYRKITIVHAIKKSFQLISFWKSLKVFFASALIYLCLFIFSFAIVHFVPSRVTSETKELIFIILHIFSSVLTSVASVVLYIHFFFKYYDEFEDEDESESITDHLVFEDV